MSYESRLKQMMDWNSMLATKEREGHDEGRKEGRDEGRKEGREEGKREIIENLIGGKDWSDEEIAEISRVSVDFVQQIREELSSQ